MKYKSCLATLDVNLGISALCLFSMQIVRHWRIKGKIIRVIKSSLGQHFSTTTYDFFFAYDLQSVVPHLHVHQSYTNSKLCNLSALCRSLHDIIHTQHDFLCMPHGSWSLFTSVIEKKVFYLKLQRISSIVHRFC
jgi:hypothetical protein